MAVGDSRPYRDPQRKTPRHHNRQCLVSVIGETKMNGTVYRITRHGIGQPDNPRFKSGARSNSYEDPLAGYSVFNGRHGSTGLKEGSL
jgi:hypothetical protein